jgi:steroid 5-alpha reductase family enzyme
MSTLHLWLQGLPAMSALGLVAWVLASARRNVGLVDVFWSLFFLAGVIVYAGEASVAGPRALLVVALVLVWALRLALHLALRNWSKPEDHRYQAIRARNEPGFAWKSLYLVFGLQVVLAWIISAPLAGATAGPRALSAVDAIGTALALFGIAYESLADLQLARFRSQTTSAGRVMDQGLWRYSRHPNYFGEFCVWWGIYLLALAAGAWWTLYSPLLMSVLLLKVSGVALLEKDIGERRPAYHDYIARTNGFFPGPRRS